MPQGKPAGRRCVQLDDGNRCMIFGRPDRPAVCAQLKPSLEMCGPLPDKGAHALQFLERLERLTAPQAAGRQS